MQMIEYMEECILRLGLSGKFLNIVHQQNIYTLVKTDKIVHPIITNSIGILH